MNAVLQDIAVGLIILASAAYAVWALAPRALRPAIARFVERVTLGRLRASKLIKNAPGCGSCETCATDKPAAPVIPIRRQ